MKSISDYESIHSVSAFYLIDEKVDENGEEKWKQIFNSYFNR